MLQVGHNCDIVVRAGALLHAADGRMEEPEAAPSGDSAGSLGGGLDTTLPGEETSWNGRDPSRDDLEDEPLERGGHVGRYTVLERIGAGGMGVVYAAFDPQLDRRVALKVMHVGGAKSTDSGGRARLLREAQAMAKLSHPNVITVHDVGTFGDRVFVAMEFIEGSTLRDWVGMERHWSEVVDAFVRAGRGLAAAHAAGLVHRDFKPDNVLIGNDGRVLVMDFGLARQAGPRTGPDLERLRDAAASSSSSSSNSATRDLNLTRTGAMLGTPAYMAPEQHRGELIGPHADQFSFCVALYESLYRERPFSGSSMTSLAMNVLDGRIRPPPRDSKIPSWLRAVVVRGLALDPLDRHPSMDALLAELQRDPPQARRPWLVAGIALVLGGGITAIYLGTRSSRIEACKESARAAHALWSPQRREAIAARFEAADTSYASASWQSIDRTLDAYVEAWTSVYDVRCTADANSRARRSAEHDDPGLLCLDDRRDDLDRMLTELQTSEDLTRSIRNGVSAVQTLPPPAQCTSISRNDTGDLRLLASVSRRAELEEVHASLSKSRVLVALGDPKRALDALSRARTRADAAKAPRLQAEALQLRARAQVMEGATSDAEASLREAIVLAAQTGRVDVEAAAWTVMTDVVALRQGLFDEGRRVALAAEAAIARAGDDPRARARLLNALGSIAQAEGAYDKAGEQFRRALAVAAKHLPSEDIRLADIHENIGSALEGAGRYPAAAEHHNAALAIREQVLGTSHPEVARTLLLLAAAIQGEERLETVEATLVRARMLLDPTASIDLGTLPEPSVTLPALPESMLDMEHPVEFAQYLDQLGLLRRSQESFEDAGRLHARAAAMFEHWLGPGHRDVGYALVNLGLALADQRRHTEALPHLRRALEVWTKTLSPGHPDLGYAHLNLANSLWSLGQAESAREQYALALGVWEAALGEDHPLVAFALTGLGRTMLEMGDFEAALIHLERAYELRDHEQEDDLNIAEVRLLLGRAQYSSGRDPTQAMELILRARDAVGAYEPADEAGIRRVLTGGEQERFTDQLVPAGLRVYNRYRPR